MIIPVILETARLRLRPFTAGDRKDFSRFMTNNVVTQYLNFLPAQRTEEGAEDLLDQVMDSYGTDRPIFSLVIAEKAKNRFIGSCGFTPLDDEKNLECYYALLPEYWGRGYATEAVSKLIEYAFEMLGASSVSAYTSIKNRRAWGVAQRCGMKDMGPVRYRKLPGKKFSITRVEYLNCSFLNGRDDVYFGY